MLYRSKVGLPLQGPQPPLSPGKSASKAEKSDPETLQKQRWKSAILEQRPQKADLGANLKCFDWPVLHYADERQAKYETEGKIQELFPKLVGNRQRDRPVSRQQLNRKTASLQH